MDAPARTHPYLLEYPLRRVVSAYPPGPIRAYCIVRSHILRNHILSEIGQYLPASGDVLELGCGFGLFANCFAWARPSLRVTGVDLNARRIRHAQAAAARCGIPNVTFHCGDARAAFAGLPPQACVYLLDLVHHLPPADVDAFLAACWGALRPGGTLVIKDVSDRPWHKMAFTYALDVLMTGGELPHYLSPRAFIGRLEALGAAVAVHSINDYLPYPHMLYVCTKPA